MPELRMGLWLDVTILHCIPHPLDQQTTRSGIAMWCLLGSVESRRVRGAPAWIGRSPSQALLARDGVLQLHPLSLHFSRIFHGILRFHILDVLLYLTPIFLHVLGLTFCSFNLLLHGVHVNRPG